MIYKIMYKEDLPPTNPNIPGDNSYTYAQTENFSAVYFITNIYDFNGIKIGETRYDAKITNLLGGSTITYTAITKINSYHGCHDIYIYFTGIRSYKIVSGGNIDLSFENTVVQNVVVDGKTYNSADYHTKINSDRKIIVTINY
jgi:hypothetical protein